MVQLGKMMNYHFTEDELKPAMEEMDSSGDGNGDIDFTEFCKPLPLQSIAVGHPNGLTAGSQICGLLATNNGVP